MGYVIVDDICENPTVLAWCPTRADAWLTLLHKPASKGCENARYGVWFNKKPRHDEVVEEFKESGMLDSGHEAGVQYDRDLIYNQILNVNDAPVGRLPKPGKQCIMHGCEGTVVREDPFLECPECGWRVRHRMRKKKKA